MPRLHAEPASLGLQRRALVQAGYRVVLWDQRSHGQSEHGSRESSTIDRLGQDLAQRHRRDRTRGPARARGALDGRDDASRPRRAVPRALPRARHRGRPSSPPAPAAAHVSLGFGQRSASSSAGPGRGCSTGWAPARTLNAVSPRRPRPRALHRRALLLRLAGAAGGGALHGRHALRHAVHVFGLPALDRATTTSARRCSTSAASRPSWSTAAGPPHPAGAQPARSSAGCPGPSTSSSTRPATSSCSSTPR